MSINDTQIYDMISAWAERRYDEVDFAKLVQELRSHRKEVTRLKELLESYKRQLKDARSE